MIRDDDQPRPGLWPESRYIQLQVERQGRLARIPEPEAEFATEEKPCTQCLQQVQVDRLVEDICAPCRRQMTPGHKTPSLGRYQRASLAALRQRGSSMTVRQLSAATGAGRMTVRAGLIGLQRRGLIKVYELCAPRRYELTHKGRHACE